MAQLDSLGTASCVVSPEVLCWRAAVLAAYDSFKWMGCVICAVAMFGVAPIYFPMWGGLLCGPKAGATEEDYYFSEYTPAEREQGHHLASSKFVSPCLLPSMFCLPCRLLCPHCFTSSCMDRRNW